MPPVFGYFRRRFCRFATPPTYRSLSGPSGPKCPESVPEGVPENGGVRVSPECQKGVRDSPGTLSGDFLDTPEPGAQSRGRKLNTNLFFSNFSGASGISRQNPGISRQKSLIPWVSRDIPNFLAPTPSRGRPPPHQKISGLKSLGLGSFFVPDKGPRGHPFEHSLGHPRFRGHPRGHSRDTSGPKGPRDSCSRSEGLQLQIPKKDWRVPNPPGANPLVAERAFWRSSQSCVTGSQQPIGNPYRFLSFLLHTWQPLCDPSSHSWGRLFQLPGG